MSNEHDHPTASTTQPGPSILEERTLSGIFVHFLGLGTGVVLPALVYLVAENEFTRENARNAFNWQVIVTGVFTLMFGLLGSAIAIDSVFPEESAVQYLGLALLVSGAIIMFGSTLFFFVNFAFGLIAMGKAIFGTAWTYPLAPDFVGWLAARTGDDSRWWRLLVPHLLITPLLGAFFALESGTENDPLFVVGFGLVLAVLLTSVLTPGVLVRDMQSVAARTSWQPQWLWYIGGPAIVAVFTYLVAAVQFTSENPGGDAIYAFAGALWVTVLIYLLRRYRQVGAS